MGRGRAAVVRQGAEDGGQHRRVRAVVGGVDIARTGCEGVEGLGVALAAVTEEVVSGGIDGAAAFV